MKDIILFIVGIALVFGLIFAVCWGYVANIVELTKTDFQSPIKAEIIRTAGVLIPPVGVIVGYINIED